MYFVLEPDDVFPENVSMVAFGNLVSKASCAVV